jgi:predicted ATPase/transcriptional regulator with XRE-family HTH domain
MEQRMSFGYWIRRRRKALDLTQPELAHQVGCAVGTIQKLEGDERRPSKQLAARLADVLRISSEERAQFLKVARAELASDQLEIDERASEISPLDAPDRPATNLPNPPTPLVGRERDVTAVTGLLCRSGVRLVTLTGPGGIGKTRLGLQAAEDVQDQFADGVWFVNLAPISDPGLIITTVAQALGVRESGGQAILEQLRAYLHEKRTLLLLDNVEQVVEVAPLISQLLAHAPGLKVLATSRTTLRLSGEYEFAVPPLGLPPPAEWLDESSAQPLSVPAIERCASVRLFVERAQAARSGFRLTVENAEAVAEICRRLDGLPLAIELAAARVKLISTRALLARLDDRLALLTGGPRDLPARQQTIRDTIDWSYNLLDEGEKQLFARLGVFVGGWTIEAAEAIIGDVQAPKRATVLDGLSSLLDKSMVRQVEDLAGEPRFTMLETIHEYALERLQRSGELDVMQQRHADFFLALAEGWRHEATGYAEVALFDQLEIELANLRAALAWSHASPAAAVMELRLVATLTHFFVVRGYAVEGWERLKAALLRGAAVPIAIRADALAAVGNAIPHYFNDPAQAQAFIEEGLAFDKRRENPRGIAWQLMSLGTITGVQGKYQRARELFEQSETYYQSLDDTWGQSVTQFALGQVALLQNDLERANLLLERSLVLCRASIDRPWAIARRLTARGFVVLAQGQHHSARALFMESLALCSAGQDKVDIPLALVGLAGVALAEGQAPQAAELLGAAQALTERFGAFRGLFGDTLQVQVRADVRAQLDATTFDIGWTAGRMHPFDTIGGLTVLPPIGMPHNLPTTS